MTQQLQMFEKDIAKGYTCPCCSQYVRAYERKLNSSMARVLLLIYQSGKRDFFHVENWLKEIGESRLRADFHKLRFWSLLEQKKEKRADESNRNGYYKITGRGIMFAENNLRVQRIATIFNNKFLGFSGTEITITDALKSGGFNYSELMHPKIETA